MSAPSSVSTRLISPAKRRVAWALCFDDISEPITESFEFTAAPKVTLKRDRKHKSAALVETKVRCSARLSALRVGYHLACSGTRKSKGLNKSPHTLKKRKTKLAQSDGAATVPPPTAIVDL